MTSKCQFGAVPIAALCIFLGAFAFGPFAQIHYLSMMPGDLGDARLNNYFLENIYQFFSGRSSSLWHLDFFSPFPYVLGFSDNLFGASPVYLIARFLTGQTDTAFQIWYLSGYCANFAAAYYALRRLETSSLAAGIGAAIFAFALPVTSQSGHAQLHYRFGAPLSIAMLVLFLEKKDWRYVVSSTSWLVWQFYCTIYIGFFTLLTLGSIILLYLCYCIKSDLISRSSVCAEYIARWRSLSRKTRRWHIFILLFLAGLLVLLFYPYWQVLHLYDIRRSFAEIASMLPRLQSYFLADLSWVWSSWSKTLTNIPMRYEHQMFMGLVPLLLALIGVFWKGDKRNGMAFYLLAGSLLVLILLTLKIGKFTFWSLCAGLPLASAMRVMTRIVLVILFPVAYFAALAIDKFGTRFTWSKMGVWGLVIPCLLFEFSAVSMPTSAKATWRQSVQENERVFPETLPHDPIVFFAQQKERWVVSELDAMWAALSHGVKTLNGYSGTLPPGFSYEYGNNCDELSIRIISYLKFKGLDDMTSAYHDLMQRIVPIGFEGCDEFRGTMPSITKSEREYTADEFRRLHYRMGQKYVSGNRTFVECTIINSGSLPFSALSGLGKPIRISWRFLDAEGKPMSNWDTTRKDLPRDIPAHGEISVRIPIDPKLEVKGGTLQVSMVQEVVFWAHDIDMPPVSIPWD